MRYNNFIRKSILIISDMLIITGAYLLAYWLRLAPTERFQQYHQTLQITLPWLLGIRFLCGLLVRQYNWSFRHASLSEAFGLIMAGVGGSIAFIVLCFYGNIVGTGTDPFIHAPPRSVYAIELMVSLIGMGGIRFFPRYIYQQFLRKSARLVGNGESQIRTIIYGAGYTGELILRDLLRTRIYPYHIVGLVDDNPTKWNASIHGYRVLGASKDLPELIEKHRVDKLLIAAPSLSATRLREIIDLCGNHHIRFKIVPSYTDIVTKGDAGPITLKDLQLEDLLQRDPINFDHSRMAEFFVDKTVLVTGAAGSIGSELCRQIVHQGVRRLVALDVNENDLYFLQLELGELTPHVKFISEIASIREKETLEAIFKRYRPEIVFHAAAHKHVPLMELCPAEALKNNVLGTRNVAECADAHGAERFVLISTDKAVRPSNVMGASKCLAEFLIRDRATHSKTHFMAVRFGNVLGSNGSLVPILQRQIARGGPVTITHPKITRYFMTIPEAVGLVLVAAVQNEGTVCVLDMGEPLSVDRLARQMISLTGLIPDKDIKIVYTGLRPGEKMYEELFAHGEQLSESSHPKIRVAQSAKIPTPIPEMLQQLREALDSGSADTIRAFLQQHVPGYQPMKR